MSMIAQEYAAVTEAQLGNHVRFPQPEFAYVIYVYDEEDDLKNSCWLDSVWTNETDALNRMKILERMENILLDMDTSKKYPYRYKLHGYSKKFPYPEGLSIHREKSDGTIYDNKYFIVYDRTQFNSKELLKPFNPHEYEALVNKIKGK